MRERYAQLCSLWRQLRTREDRSRDRRPRRRAISLYHGLAWAGVLALLGCLVGSPGVVQANSKKAGSEQASSKERMQSLDEQVQEVKSDVLGIAAELSRLEEKLLYPSNTQVAVFVSLAEGEDFRLDSVRVQLDGELVAHHIYSFKELEALQKGGVQRIYTGNVPTGAHQLEVSVAGEGSGGGDFSATESFSFDKEAEPKLVGITLAGQVTGGARIELGGW